MVDPQALEQLHLYLTRIFCMPVCRTTYREIQSAFMVASKNDTTLFTDMMESSLTGQVKPTLKDKVDSKSFNNLIDDFCQKIRVAKDVHDKAQFISFITSDLVNQPNNVIFSNCIKTVEGNENRFITDIESTIQLLQHFVGRIQEASKLENAKDNIKKSKQDLIRLVTTLNDLVEL